MSPQARSVETRSVIIRAAADVFAAYGYGGTSMADICQAAGMTKGALYFHFASKEALALAIIDSGRQPARQARIVDHGARQHPGVASRAFQAVFRDAVDRRHLRDRKSVV